MSAVTSSCFSIIGWFAMIHELILEPANLLFMLRDLFLVELHPLDDRRDAHSETDTHRHERVPLVGAL
jgi:hypothetical protein